MLHFPLLQCQPPSLHPRWSPADPTRGRYMSRETCLPSKIVLKIFSLTRKVFLWKMGLFVGFLIALCSELSSLTGSSFSPPSEQEEKRETQKTRQSSIDYWIWWRKWNSEFVYMFICIPQGNYFWHRMSLIPRLAESRLEIRMPGNKASTCSCFYSLHPSSCLPPPPPPSPTGHSGLCCFSSLLLQLFPGPLSCLIFLRTKETIPVTIAIHGW